PLPPLPISWLAAVPEAPISLPPQRSLEPGNQDLVGLVQLVSLARALAAKRIFEIGTLNGLTAFTLAANLPEAHIDTLDLPAGAVPELRLSESDRHTVAAAPVRSSEGSEAERVVQHCGDSASFDFTSFHGTCDLVFVDGAHSYEYVAND